MKRLLLALPFLSLPLVACEANGPLMRPGENCMMCHGANATTGGERGPRFTVAGTVFPTQNSDVNSGVDGVTVTITDASKRVITLTTNSAGNFYTNQSVTFPINAEFSKGGTVIKMNQAVSDGGCSSCHTVPPTGGAPGRNWFQ